MVAARIKLTPKREKFAQKFVSCGNQSQAYRHAFNVGKNTKPETIWTRASHLMADDKVSARVAQLQEQLAEKSGVTAQRVVEEMAKIAFGDLRGLFDEAGNLLPPNKWADKDAAIVAGMDVVTRKAGDGEVEHVAKIKQWDKPKALEMLARHLGMFNDKITVTGLGGLAGKLDRAKGRRT